MGLALGQRHRSVPDAFPDGASPATILRDEPRLWDLYTLKDDYSPGRPGQKDAYKSIYAGGDPESLLDPAVSDYLRGRVPEADYPDGKTFAVCLTHDVDVIDPPLAHRGLASLYHGRRGAIGPLAREVLWRKGGKGSYDYRNFREIMDLEDRYGARSSFYFLAARRNVQPLRMYDVESLEGDLGEIADRGWEVGLHGGYYAYDDPAAIREEKRRLEKALGRPVCGYRNHYLCFRVPDTWAHLSTAGFRYDTTLGYNNVPGFRNGTCRPFRPVDRRSGREVDILEVPLAIMDRTLFSYAGSPDRAWAIARRLIDAVERDRGVLTLLWHNDVFRAPYRGPWAAMYERILQYCHARNAWLAGGAEIVENL